MSIPVEIIDGRGNKLTAHVLRHHDSLDKHSGVLTLNQPLLRIRNQGIPFLNPNFGTAINQDASFSGIGSFLHTGGTTSEAISSTTTSTTSNKLVDTGQTFTSTASVGMVVFNTTDTTFANVTNVDSNTVLTLSADIMTSGENYRINPVFAGTIVTGSWLFADAGKITITSVTSLAEASFDGNSASSFDMSNYESFRGKVDLDTYSPLTNDIEITLDLNGVPQSSIVNLNDFMDTGDFTEQNFTIPKESLGLSTQLINGFTLRVTRSGGAKPTVKFDELCLLESGAGQSITFSAAPSGNDVYHVVQLDFFFSDVLDVTTANASAKPLDDTRILGLAALTEGIQFQRINDGSVVSSFTIRRLRDIIGPGVEDPGVWSLNNNTSVKLSVKFPTPIILHGADQDRYQLIINDDLSGLTRFTVFIRGGTEIPPGQDFI